MPRDGSGNYTLPSGNPVVTNTVISSSGWANPTLSDIAAAITQSMSRDGQTTPTANLTMGNFRVLSLGNAQARSDAINAGQVQDDAMVQLSSIAGTGDAITASTAPAITAYAKGSRFLYIPVNGNTLTNPTIAIDGLTAQTITQSNGLGLWTGAIVVGTPYEIVYDGTNFRIQSGTLGAQVPTSTFSANAFRNKLIDGNFDLWNVGTSFTTSGLSPIYTADMWLAAGGSSGTCTVSKQVLAAGTSFGTDPVPSNFLSFQQTVASSGSALNSCSLGQHIENVNTLSGQSATFSADLQVSSGTMTGVILSINQFFGSGGSGTVNTNITLPWTLTTTMQRLSARIDIPSIVGKTVGAGNYLSVSLIFPTGITFTLFASQLQFEACPAAAPTAGLPTPFEWRGLATEQQMARRYLKVFPIANAATVFAVGSCPSATTARAIFWLGDAPMSQTPAVSTTQTLQLTGSFAATTASIAMQGNDYAIISATVSGATAWQTCHAILASAGNIIFDGRL